jgi:uncharacterized protein (DUF885 family)
LWVLSLAALAPAASHAAMPAPAATTSAATSALRRLCDDYWQGILAADPTFATSLGDRRYDARLADPSRAARERERARLERTLADARAIPAGSLPAAERRNQVALMGDVRDRIDMLSCGSEEWLVDCFHGPQVSFMELPDLAPIETPQEGTDYVRRCLAIPLYLDRTVANLRLGMAAGRYPCSAVLRKTLSQLVHLRMQRTAEWPLMRPAGQAHGDWPPGAAAAFQRDLAAAVRDSVLPAFERYRAFLTRDLLPFSRKDKQPGLASLPGGPECYRRLVRLHTSLDVSPDSLHRLGLAQVARARAELGEIGARALASSDPADVLQRLREDPSLRCGSGAEIEAQARASLARAQAALPRAFANPPRTACEVQVLADAGPSVLAFYRPPSPGSGRPGYYMLGVAEPATRRRFEGEVLAFHEGVPGHHVQVAIAQELHNLPEFRRHQRISAFAEGWALYSERLADELGLYSSDLDRLGMVTFDLWRSSRLVVDTGLNALGWSRVEAESYLTENTTLAEDEILEEIDRCLSWPGQALAYKVGQLEILRLRDEGRTRLGARFDPAGFHDVVLGEGAVPLPVLREQVEAYYARVESGRSIGR